MIYIDVPDMNDSMSMVKLDGKLYFLRFTYNEVNDYWSFGIYDAKREPLIAMTKIVPNYPLTFWCTDMELPRGIFACSTNLDKIGRKSFSDVNTRFVYIPHEEVGVGT